MNKILISPSFLSADFANIERDVKTLNQSQADWFHLDIMDGRFVPNISFGFPVVSAIKKHAEKPLDVHLMILEPEKYIEEFRRAGADILTVHYEACNHLNRTICQIKDAGMIAGVSLNPHTPVNVLENILEYVDMVLIMTVNPGFGGQKFIENSYKKIQDLKSMINRINPSVMIQVDGGVTGDNAAKLANSGANILVAGNYIFKSPDIYESIKKLKNCIV